MTTGTVKLWNADRGYGQITEDGSGKDVIASADDIQTNGSRELEEGQRVEFEVAMGNGHPVAVMIRPM
ncbi:cold-shock protein [Kitasatospora misakiensis]|uniref:Cold-shock protein n=1 Tax=Kitasatospora misakiensis TaxID=67330 RepID=A0ABW0X039_9ACTN